MRIQSEFDIRFNLPVPTTMVALLHLYPTLGPFLLQPESLQVESGYPGSTTLLEPVFYNDAYGNLCSRFAAPAGPLRLAGTNILEVAGDPDAINPDAQQHRIEDLPNETLQFLLASRYCEVDQIGAIAQDLFGATTPGWARAIYIRDWVHNHVRFDYNSARPTKTALDVFTERVGVCRDFQHLAIALTRAMNIPARYVTGHLGDIRHPYSGAGDFSAWYEVFLDGRWYTMDARHNVQRIGRLLMAVGRDATDVAITTSFGAALLTHFYVESNEVDLGGNRVPLPQSPTGTPFLPDTDSTAQPTPEIAPGADSVQPAGATQTETATS